MSASIAAPLVRRLVDAIVDRGVDRAALLAAAGVSEELLRPLVLRLPYAVVEDLVEAAERLTGDDRIGFHLSEWRPVDVMGLPAILLMASDSLRTAHHHVVRVARLWSSGYRVDVREVEGGLYGVVDLGRPERPALAHLREMLLADGARMVRKVTGRPVAIDVSFPHARRGDRSEYEAFFGGAVTFGAGETAYRLRDEDLDLPLPTASHLVLESFLRRADDELAALTGVRSVAERVRALLESDLQQQRLGETTLDDVAARLRMSGRSLQRALGREGAPFAELMDGVRKSAGLLAARVRGAAGVPPRVQALDRHDARRLARPRPVSDARRADFA